MTERNYAAFILTHGRPDGILTWRTLRACGYTGRIYIILDNEDPTIDEHREKYGADNVVVFDKAAVEAEIDTADTQPDRKAVVYARNASFQIARDLGLDYFIQLDDDYQRFSYRVIQEDTLLAPAIRDLDAVFEAMFTFLDDTGAASVAMSQAGDHIGGLGGNIRKKIRRKAMNSFFLRTDRPVQFIGKLNDDVNAYVVHGSRGDVFFTIMHLCLVQRATQAGEGGMTDTYLKYGTYVKSFYTVMMAPSCVQIQPMPGNTEHRIHHWVNWTYAVPKIINESHRKPLPTTAGSIT